MNDICTKIVQLYASFSMTSWEHGDSIFLIILPQHLLPKNLFGIRNPARWLEEVTEASDQADFGALVFFVFFLLQKIGEAQMNSEVRRTSLLVGCCGFSLSHLLGLSNTHW